MSKLVDMTDSKHGMWTVLGRAPSTTEGATSWLCRCDCGAERAVLRQSLVRGQSSGCGCARAPDISGQTFGRLRVLRRATSRQGARWVCACACGQETVKGAGYLRSAVADGQSPSCGCVNGNTRHGMYKAPEYRAWAGARSRCTNPNTPGFEHYGGRGIAVCDRWDSFEAFLEDMGAKPGDRYSLDRIDVDGNYEPGNCRWATAKQQHANKRCQSDGCAAYRAELEHEVAELRRLVLGDRNC